MTASRVWCRSGALRSPPRSSANRSSSRRSISSTDITRTLAAASSIASGSPSRRRTTLAYGFVVERDARPGGRGALAEQLRRGVRRPSWPSGKTRSAAIASGARVVVSTRSRLQVGRPGRRPGRRPPRSTCSQLSRISSVGAWSRTCAIRARTSVRCSAVSTRRPLTESRTPSAEPTSPTTSSGEETPTSSTKCTTGCSASRPSRWASRVLPEPAGPEDRGDPWPRGPAARSARMSSSRPTSEVASNRSPSRTGRSAASSSACSGPERRSRVDAEPVGQVGAVPLVALERGGRAVHGGGRAQQGDDRGLVVGVRRPASSGSASSWSPRPDSARPRTALAIGTLPGRGSTEVAQRPVRGAARRRHREGLPGPGRGRGSGRGGPPPRGRPPPRRGARARRRPRRAARAGSRGRCGPPRRARSATRARETTTCSALAGLAGTSSGPHTSSTSRSSETWLPAATRAASSACVRPPGSGVPCQDTSSSSSRSTGVSAGLPRNARRPGRPRRRARRPSPASVRVRSGARNRSAKASDLWPAPTWSPV